MGRAVMATVATVVMFAGVDSARAALYEGDFPAEESGVIGLTLGKEGGKRYLQTANVSSVPATCEGDDTHIGSDRNFDPPEGRVRGGAFKIVQGEPGTSYFFKVAGELKRSGKVVGTWRYRGDFGANGVCDTGAADFVAIKQ